MTSRAIKTTVAPYVLIPVAAELTGYSRRAIELKIARGQWVEGREWVIGPDGHRLISIEGYKKWVEQGASRPARNRYASSSHITEKSSATP